MKKRISELTYSLICDVLGRDKFHMHYDDSDAMREIYDDVSFFLARTRLMVKFGDVLVSLHPEESWSRMVQIEDESWRQAHLAYVAHVGEMMNNR